MSKPVFSLISPAVRSGFYKRLYNSACYKNKVPFEVIFVGNEKPKKKIGDNFHYIYTNVKPAQCLEIAARNAQGDYLINVADDLVLSKYFFGRVESYIKIKPDNIFISFRYAIDGVMKDDWLYYNKPDCPLGASGVFNREHWYKLGGIDKRFIFMMADTDMQLRFRETKELFITPDCWLDELRDAHQVQVRKPGFGDSKSSRRASKMIPRKEESKCMEQFWIKEGGEISKHRLKEVISFDNKDILIKSQGRNLSKIWD